MSQNQNMDSRFTEVGGGARGTSWDPRATEKNGMRYDPNWAGNMLEGYLAAVKEIPLREKDKNGNNRTITIFKIQVVNPDKSLGEIFDVVGDTVLGDRLMQIPLQSYVGIKYMGRKHKDGFPAGSYYTQTNSYHVWAVGVDHNVMPMQQVAAQFGIKMPVAPPATQPQFSQQNAPQYGNQGQQPVFGQQQFQGQQQQQFQQQQPYQGQQQNFQATPPQQQQNFQQQPAQSGTFGGNGNVPQPAQQQSFQAPPQTFNAPPPQQGQQNFQAPPPQTAPQGQPFNPGQATTQPQAPQQQQFSNPAPTQQQGQQQQGQPFKTDLPF